MDEVKPLIKYGWLRALIYFTGAMVVMLLLAMAAVTLLEQLGFTGKSDEDKLENIVISYAISGAGLLLFTYIIRRFIDRKTFVSMGFRWRGFADEGALGFLIAVALLGIGSLLLVGLGYLTFLSISASPLAMLIELILMILVAFVEEVLFRGYVLNNLMQSMNKWVALLISAALFAFIHITNPDVTVLAIANVFVGGLFLGVNYIYTKNLWFSIFFHFAWNFLQGPILGYDVSGMKLESLFHQTITGPALWTGGAFGFEGSLLCLVLLGASTIVLIYGFAKKYGTITFSK